MTVGPVLVIATRARTPKLSATPREGAVASARATTGLERSVATAAIADNLEDRCRTIRARLREL
jgi:hypothetical protein